MKKSVPITTSSPKTLLDAPILTDPVPLAGAAIPAPVAFTSADPVHLAIHAQPQYYFIPSNRPLWENPLNDS